MYVNNWFFQTCFRQSAKGKMAAWGVCLSKTGLLNRICYSNFNFHCTPCLLRFLCVIISCYGKCVSCVYIIYPIYPISCLTIIYHFIQFRIISFSLVLFRTILAKLSTAEGSSRNTYNIHAAASCNAQVFKSDQHGLPSEVR